MDWALQNSECKCELYTLLKCYALDHSVLILKSICSAFIIVLSGNSFLERIRVLLEID